MIFLRGSRSGFRDLHDGIIYNHVPSKTRKYYLTEKCFNIPSSPPSFFWIRHKIYTSRVKKFIFIYPIYPLYIFPGRGWGYNAKETVVRDSRRSVIRPRRERRLLNPTFPDDIITPRDNLGYMNARCIYACIRNFPLISNFLHRLFSPRVFAHT